jgi:hypothetical protein
MVLAIFAAIAIVGQFFTVLLGLAVDHLVSPAAGLLTFLVTYYLMFWVAWRITLLLVDREPRHQISLSRR